MSSVNAGLPACRDDWPHEVLTAAARFACGDVVEEPPYFYVAEPRYAVLEMTKRYDDGTSCGPEIIDANEIAAPFGVITSQTCDVGEIDFDPPSKPFVSVAPVFNGEEVLPPEILSLLRKGRQIQAWMHLPALSDYEPGVWVADFRIEMPIEKSWLVGREPIKGFRTEAAARAIPRAIAEIRNRPAWADVVGKSVQSVLHDQLKSLKADNRGLYNSVVSQIIEVGARSDSMLDPSWLQLAGFYDQEIVEDVASWWNAAAKTVAEELSGHGIESHQAQLLDLAECPVNTYRQYAPILLGRHSPQ